MSDKKGARRRVQDRRSVSLKPHVYRELAAFCARHNISMASLVESLILERVSSSMDEPGPPPPPTTDPVPTEPPAVLFLG